jgi:hypothetical protein
MGVGDDSCHGRVLLGLAEQRLVTGRLDIGDLDRGQLVGERPNGPGLILAVGSRLGQDVDYGPHLKLGGIGRRHDNDDGPIRTLLDHLGHERRVSLAATPVGFAE